jgi:dienelactone hydrolase
VIRGSIVALVLAGALAAQTLPVQKGVVIPSIQAIDKPDTYALFLPTSYTPDRKWPIIYALDPLARGAEPLNMMKDMAEKYGYILVGSNVSRNGPMKVSIDAMRVLWDDTHSRLSIDPARRYFTGFSGGARASTSIALLCGGCVAGVIAHGAGFPPEVKPSKENLKFLYYATTGDLDFNYVELLKLDESLNEIGATHRVRFFSGGHQYAIPEVWEEIFGWLQLQAMKQGSIPKNPAWIASQVTWQEKRIQQAQAEEGTFGAYKELQRAINDFNGMADISAWQQRSSVLAKDKAVKDGPKRERFAADAQARQTYDAYRDLNQIRDEPSDRTDPLLRIKQTFGSMRDRVVAAREKKKENDPEILILRRTLSQVLAQSIEMGQQATRDKDFTTAIIFYDLVVDLARFPGFAHFEKARTLSLMGRKKDVLPELKKAVETGMDPKDLASVAEFAEFRENPEFKTIQQMTPPELPKR